MFTIDAFVADCRRALTDDDPTVVVAELLRRAIGDRDSLVAAVQHWRDAGGGEQGALFRSDDLTILHAAVPAGFVSPRHDHTIWAVIGVYEGQEDNTFYRFTPQGLEESGRVSITAGNVQVLRADVVHRISNPLDQPLLAVHVYGGDLLGIERTTWDDATGAPTRFDLAALERH